jgi:predicted GNAT superfamily acetyltransferase
MPLLTGVVPEHQSQGLGYRLKLFQAEFARLEGIERIAWAFDPLQAGNAHFNLTRLGAHATRYVENMYGERTDRLNAGVPTDRVIAEWIVASTPPAPLPVDHLTQIPPILELAETTGRGCVPIGIHQAAVLNHPRLLLEIPIDITGLRRQNPALAETWRAVVGQAFQLAFGHSYRGVQFVRDDSSAPRRGFYVLERIQS